MWACLGVGDSETPGSRDNRTFCRTWHCGYYKRTRLANVMPRRVLSKGEGVLFAPARDWGGKSVVIHGTRQYALGDCSQWMSGDCGEEGLKIREALEAGRLRAESFIEVDLWQLELDSREYQGGTIDLTLESSLAIIASSAIVQEYPNCGGERVEEENNEGFYHTIRVREKFGMRSGVLRTPKRTSSFPTAHVPANNKWGTPTLSPKRVRSNSVRSSSPATQGRPATLPPMPSREESVSPCQKRARTVYPIDTTTSCTSKNTTSSPGLQACKLRTLVKVMMI